MENLIFIGIAGVIMLISFMFSNLKDSRRKSDIEEIYESIGFSYINPPNQSLIGSWSKFNLFSSGHSKKIMNMLTKDKDGIKITLIDFKHTIGSGKNSHTYKQTVLMYESNLLNLPDFTLKPEKIFHKIGSTFGYQDIDFDNFPKFSAQYLLRGESEDHIREFFDSNILDFFTEKQNLNIEGNENKLLYYKLGKIEEIKNLESFLEAGNEIFNLFKKEF